MEEDGRRLRGARWNRNSEAPMSDTRIKEAVGSTTGAGAPAPSDRNSLTVGPDGPIVLHDVHFLEQMAHMGEA